MNRRRPARGSHGEFRKKTRAIARGFRILRVMKRHNAFTLIELLVVIAIIAILAGFALPVFARAQERARAQNCMNNLNQLGKGFVQYLNDSDDSMFSIKSTGDDTWPKVLQRKYVTGWQTFRSPFDKVTNERPKDESGNVPISYGINEQLTVKTFGDMNSENGKERWDPMYERESK